LSYAISASVPSSFGESLTRFSRHGDLDNVIAAFVGDHALVLVEQAEGPAEALALFDQAAIEVEQ
jgi:hypothetical protein